MESRPLLLCLTLLSCAVSNAAPEPPPVNRTGDLLYWAAEQMPGGTVTVRAGALDIQDAGGSTIWLREKITA
ncbi:MAG: hypothetical protein NTX09_20385, partial [Verrucomicrobia bacterium]|nr:hypothetical protein [Verrucomicrobiota bacterium]